MSAITVDGLTKYYGDVRGIEDLTFSVREGEVFGFLGPNGAGKTTTIRTLMGFLRPTDGGATMLGRDVTDEAELIEAKRSIGFLPAEPGFDGTVTGRRILDYQARLKGDERRAELLEAFEPPLDRPVGEYSRGNVQKLAIVQAFMHDPDLLVMDEPTSGLDPLLQDRFHEFVRAERAAGKTAFFSSHVLSEVREVCDRVGIVREGHLVALEEVETLLERGGKRVRVQVAEDVGPGAFEMDGVHDPAGEDVIAFTFTGDYDALVDRLAEFTVLDLDVEEAPLEEVFMRFYGEAPDEGVEPDDERIESADDEVESVAGTVEARTAGSDAEHGREVEMSGGVTAEDATAGDGTVEDETAVNEAAGDDVSGDDTADDLWETVPEDDADGEADAEASSDTDEGDGGDRP